MFYLSHVIETFELLKGKEWVRLQYFGSIYMDGTCDNMLSQQTKNFSMIYQATCYVVRQDEVF